jgi:hypothetical protein
LHATTAGEMVSCVASADFAAAAVKLLVWFLVVIFTGAVIALFFAATSLPPEPLPMANVSAFLVPIRYGGEAAEVISSMEYERAFEPERAFEYSAGTEHWLARVEEEKRLVEALPFVVGTVAFIYSEKANQNRV